MFDEFKEKIISIITSRLTILTLVILFLGGVLAYRCFDLQIVHGEEYLNDFILQIEKTRDITSTRGNIFDRNGELLAYNELAYSVKIEDVFESDKYKNKNLNETIFRLIQMVEKNGDSVITDFKVFINEDGEFEYTAEGTSLMRFLAVNSELNTICFPRYLAICRSLASSTLLRTVSELSSLDKQLKSPYCTPGTSTQISILPKKG